MTYKELLLYLSKLTEEQLSMHVVIHDIENDDYYGSDSSITIELAEKDNMVLDELHPKICVFLNYRTFEETARGES